MLVKVIRVKLLLPPEHSPGTGCSSRLELSVPASNKKVNPMGNGELNQPLESLLASPPAFPALEV